MKENCNKYTNFNNVKTIKIVLLDDVSYPEWVYEIVKNIKVDKSDTINKIKLIDITVGNIIKFCENNLTFEFQYTDENNNQLLCVKMIEINFGGETYKVFCNNNDSDTIGEYVLDFTFGSNVKKVECIQCNNKPNCLCKTT